MSALTARIPDRLAFAWVALYTRGLPVDRRDARRAEIMSDLWEHHHDESGTTSSVLARVIAGVPADLSWRFEERGLEQKKRPIDMWGSRHQIITIPGIAVLAGVVTMAGMHSAVSALVAGLMALALIGLTREVVGSPVLRASGMGMEMNMTRGIDRRTRLLIVLAASVIVLAGTYAYAMSLDHWGDTRAVIFVGVGWLSLGAALIALALLVADVVRARRR